MTEYKYYTGTSIKATTGLVAAYNMIPSNGTLVDISGNGNNGTISGAISTKDGLSFDGVDDYIPNIGRIIPLEGNEKSFSFRVKANSSNSTVISNEGGAVLAGIQIEVGGSSYINVGGAYLGVSTPLFSNQETTYDITYSKTKNELKLYINGEFHSNYNVSGSYVNLQRTFAIGRRRIFASDFFKGNIKFIKGYNYQRTAEQIKADYNNNIKPYLLEDFSNYSVGDDL